ncbi:hypothetical protein MWN34_00850 [Ancylobacter sp. 6x-1]|uniref:DUF945 domain-containing protein n=1 Tax=Ancylobacter crimeensis TaxID=2579147 RepID=A0ABT0D688_9HYPH|nr:hypothetical protein [Ancylobacter crimeensis]MCK0195454.1 hypothetical protein [Ancylobacter crimeensis]
MRKLAIVLLVLPVLAFGGYFAATTYANREAGRQIDAVFQNLGEGGVEARHGAVSFDLLARQLDVADIVLTYPQGRGSTTIAHLSAAGLGQVEGGRVKVDRLELKDLAFEGRIGDTPATHASWTAPSLVVEHYEGPAEVSAPAGRPWQIALAVLRTAKIGRITVPVSTLSTSRGTGDAAISGELAYGGTTLDDIAGGIIARLAVTPSKIATTSKDGSGAGTIGAVTGEGIDVGAWINAVTGEPVATDQTGTLVKSYRVDGYDYAMGDKVKVKGGPLTLTDLSVKAPGLPTAELMEVEAALRAKEAAGEPIEREDIAPLMDVLARAAAVTHLGSFDAGELDLASPDGAKARLTTIHVGALSDGVLSEAKIEDFAGTDHVGRPAKIARIALAGARVADILQQSAARMAEDDHAGVAPAPQRIDLVQRFEITGFEVPSEIGDGPVSIEKMLLAMDGIVDGVPAKVTGTLRMALPTAVLADQQIFALLAANNVPRITIAGDIASNWDPATGTAVIAPISLDISHVGAIAGQLRIGNVTPAAFSADDAAALAASRRETLEQAAFTLKDNGLFAMKMRELAQQQGVKEDAVRQLVTGVAAFIVNQFANDRPQLEPAGQALITFLQAPGGALTVKVTPRSTLTFGDIMDSVENDPLTLTDKVNIEASASK